MSSLAVDHDITDASRVQSPRAPERPSDGHESTSKLDLIYPGSRVAEKPRIMIRTFLNGPTRQFEFKKTFVIRLEDSELGVVASHPSLRCSGSGRTVQEAILEFCEMFEVQWADLVDCSPEELTAGARRVRESLLSIATPVSAS